ncbi:hypothetical protein GGS23DRAFT_159709 [Durotheca rogersii]|uniref:uncharacterized protein n=1 Tax=Durotheca rogersii TaxID=419775 RepID=UPI0022205C1E|nr:uncharacterized protein GGS23DRAFT_159709 [Durotheca rogersii]KAI5861246.1 hypothetical protein GGS23DRAFT_159709 [Durotheca rogersii]
MRVGLPRIPSAGSKRRRRRRRRSSLRETILLSSYNNQTRGQGGPDTRARMSSLVFEEGIQLSSCSSHYTAAGVEAARPIYLADWLGLAAAGPEPSPDHARARSGLCTCNYYHHGINTSALSPPPLRPLCSITGGSEAETRPSRRVKGRRKGREREREKKGQVPVLLFPFFPLPPAPCSFFRLQLPPQTGPLREHVYLRICLLEKSEGREEPPPFCDVRRASVRGYNI